MPAAEASHLCEPELPAREPPAIAQAVQAREPPPAPVVLVAPLRLARQRQGGQKQQFKQQQFSSRTSLHPQLSFPSTRSFPPPAVLKQHFHPTATRPSETPGFTSIIAEAGCRLSAITQPFKNSRERAKGPGPLDLQFRGPIRRLSLLGCKRVSEGSGSECNLSSTTHHHPHFRAPQRAAFLVPEEVLSWNSSVWGGCALWTRAAAHLANRADEAQELRPPAKGIPEVPVLPIGPT